MIPKVKAIINIENIVASGALGQKINLNQITVTRPWWYSPGQFPGLVFRLKRPRTTVMIFSSGKFMCTGAKSEKEVRISVITLVKELKKSGVRIDSSAEPAIQNIVASINIGKKVDLEQAACKLEKTMYEPEQFPGLICRMNKPNVVIVIFASGRLVCAGAKKEWDIFDAVHKLQANLEAQNLIFDE